MEPALKHRLIGAAVISALAIIFLPKLIVGNDPGLSGTRVPLKVPAAPKGEFKTEELPLDAPASSVPAGGVVGMDTAHPPTPAASASAATDAASGAAPATASTAASPASGPTSATPASPATPTTPVASAASPAASGKTSPTPAASAAIPPAASPATPIPAALAGGHYVVSLGTYSNAGNARALVASLKAKGLPAYADAVSMAGKPGTRVRIGPFQQRGDAEAARLRAQQLRSDMPANVVALDAATPAAPSPAPSLAAKPSPAKPDSAKPDTAKPDAAKPAPAPKPAAATATAAGKPSTPATPPPAPAAAIRAYAVQVSAFGAQRDADALRDKLHAAGFVAFTEKVHTESGERWRVRVGPTASRDDADRLRTQLSTKMNLSGMVVDYP